MRLNITLDGSEPRSGYVNRSPHGNGPGLSIGPLGDLDDLCEDGEAIELVALDVLDFLPPHCVDGVLSHWVRKLSHGGTIALGGIDLREVARMLVNNELDTPSASKLIHGEQHEPWNSRKSTLTMPLLVDQLRVQYKLSIEEMGYDGLFFLVKAKRP